MCDFYLIPIPKKETCDYLLQINWELDGKNSLNEVKKRIDKGFCGRNDCGQPIFKGWFCKECYTKMQHQTSD